MLQAVGSALKIVELRRKILFTLGMLLIYRVIAHVPVPYTDSRGIAGLLETNQLLGILNLFSGGALQNFSIAAMGVYPYITASIIVQLLQPLIPRLEEWAKEGEAGRNKINRFQYYLTVPLALLQAYGQTLTIARATSGTSGGGLFEPGFDFNLFSSAYFLPTFTIILSMTAGTMLLIWMGELIDEKGIGNGISMIIFGGIVARLFATVGQFFQAGTGSASVLGIGFFLLIMLVTLFRDCGRPGRGTAYSGAVHAPHARQQGLWRSEHPYSVKGEYGRYDPADLRPEHLAVPRHGRLVLL